MSEYSIYVSNGKVIGDSVFYVLANEALSKECKRLCDFTDALDKDPLQKKQKIAEYKCAKYRYAAVERVHMLLFHGNRVYRLSDRNKHIDIENSLEQREEYLLQVENAPQNEKIDFKLYYGITGIVGELLTGLEERLSNANDWEKIALEERIGGLQFAKECLDEAWQRRKEVIE
jgi:hypothetical protein